MYRPLAVVADTSDRLPRGPVLVDPVVNREELSMPPKITFEMAKGVTLFMLKAVMSGKGTELLELAETDLWR